MLPAHSSLDTLPRFVTHTGRRAGVGEVECGMRVHDVDDLAERENGAAVPDQAQFFLGRLFLAEVVRRWGIGGGVDLSGGEVCRSGVR